MAAPLASCSSGLASTLCSQGANSRKRVQQHDDEQEDERDEQQAEPEPPADRAAARARAPDARPVRAACSTTISAMSSTVSASEM